MRRSPATDGHAPVVRSPRAAVTAAAPVVMVALGAALLLPSIEVRVLSVGSELLGVGLIVVGLVWLLLRLTSFGRGAGVDDVAQH